QSPPDGLGRACVLLGICRGRVPFGEGDHVVLRLLAARAPGSQHVEADPSDDRRQPAGEVVQRLSLGPAKAQPGLLHCVRGVTRGPQDATRDLLQSLAVILEPFGHPGLLVHRSPFSHVVRHGGDAARPNDVTGMNPGALLRPIGDTSMQPRVRNPVELLPEAMKALHALDRSAEGLPYVTRKLVHLRASQINGCSVCVDMHARELKKAGQSDERIFAVAAWHDTPWFT